MGVTVFSVQWPGDLLVEGLKGGLGRLRDVAHNRVNRLALVVPLLTLEDILGRDTTLRQIDITCMTMSQLPDNIHTIGFANPSPCRHAER